MKYEQVDPSVVEQMIGVFMSKEEASLICGAQFSISGLTEEDDLKKILKASAQTPEEWIQQNLTQFVGKMNKSTDS